MLRHKSRSYFPLLSDCALIHSHQHQNAAKYKDGWHAENSPSVWIEYTATHTSDECSPIFQAAQNIRVIWVVNRVTQLRVFNLLMPWEGWPLFSRLLGPHFLISLFGKLTYFSTFERSQWYFYLHIIMFLIVYLGSLWFVNNLFQSAHFLLLDYYLFVLFLLKQKISVLPPLATAVK